MYPRVPSFSTLRIMEQLHELVLCKYFEIKGRHSTPLLCFHISQTTSVACCEEVFSGLAVAARAVVACTAAPFVDMNKANATEFPDAKSTENPRPGEGVVCVAEPL